MKPCPQPLTLPPTGGDQGPTVDCVSMQGEATTYHSPQREAEAIHLQPADSQRMGDAGVRRREGRGGGGGERGRRGRLE